MTMTTANFESSLEKMKEVVKRKRAAYSHTTPLYVCQADDQTIRVCLTLSGLY